VLLIFVTLPSDQVLQSLSEHPTIQDGFNLILFVAFIVDKDWRGQSCGVMFENRVPQSI
jgi:hypothetical protein